MVLEISVVVILTECLYCLSGLFQCLYVVAQTFHVFLLFLCTMEKAHSSTDHSINRRLRAKGALSSPISIPHSLAAVGNALNPHKLSPRSLRGVAELAVALSAERRTTAGSVADFIVLKVSLKSLWTYLFHSFFRLASCMLEMYRDKAIIYQVSSVAHVAWVCNGCRGGGRAASRGR